MKRKKSVLLISIILVILLLALAGIWSMYFMGTNGNEEINITTMSEPMELKFADNYISYILERESTLQFNLFGAQDVSIDGPSYFDSVDFISLENQNIEIIDYEISQGDIFGDHQLFNIILEVKLNSDEVEEVSELTLHYNQVEEISFDFGTLILKDDIGFNQGDLDVTGEQNTLAAPLPSLEANLTNQTSNSIKLSKIYDIADNLVFEFKEEVQIPNGEIEKLTISKFNEMNQHDFYTITPIVEYVRNDETNQYYMPGVVFGVMVEDDVKMEKILN